MSEPQIKMITGLHGLVPSGDSFSKTEKSAKSINPRESVILTIYGINLRGNGGERVETKEGVGTEFIFKVNGEQGKSI